MGIIVGTLDDDVLIGGDALDIISGLSGNDTIRGRGGADVIDGGDGKDVIYAAGIAGWSDGAIDEVLAGAGNDKVFGAYGDILNGGFGFDTLSIDLSSAGNGVNVDFRPMTLLDLSELVVIEIGGTQLSGFQAVAEVRGTDGNDRIAVGNSGRAASIVDGGAGDDKLRAGSGEDTLLGGDGSDRLKGAGGKDNLVGGMGDDQLAGGRGKDEMTGGRGKDVFFFDDVETAASRARADVIHDFSQNQGDRISLRAIDAVAGGSDDAFSFIGDARFSGTAGEVRFTRAGDATFVSGDTNGDAKADFTIRLDGDIALVAADFTL